MHRKVWEGTGQTCMVISLGRRRHAGGGARTTQIKNGHRIWTDKRLGWLQQRCGETETLTPHWRSSKMVQTLWKTVSQFFKKVKKELPHDATIQLPGIYLQWFILCVNLTGPWDAQILGLTSFWVCLWRCIWMRLAYKLIIWVKQIALPNGNGPHPISWRSEGNRKTQFTLSAWLSSNWDISLLLPSD